jgi:hypothetical protein
VPLSSGPLHANQLSSPQRGQIARQGVIARQRQFGGFSVAQTGKGKNTNPRFALSQHFN